MQKKLKLNSCTVNDGKISVETDKIFEVMLNPSDYKHDRAVDYNEDRTNEIDDYLNSLQEHLVFENLENLFDIIIEENNEELDILNDAIESEDHLKENFQYETNDRNNEDFINNLMKKVNIGNHPDKCTYVEAA